MRSIVLKIIFVIILLICIYAYRNLNYDYGNDRFLEKNGKKYGFNEKVYKTKEGLELSYLEGPNNGQTLILLHGQMVSKEDYAKVLPELSKSFHIYAIDYYGHGKSSKEVSKYNVNSITKDIIEFMDVNIKDKAIISGHSSGAIISANVAYLGKDKIDGLILEDGPFFTTLNDRASRTFAYQDFKLINDFLNQNKETSYTKYFLENTYMKNLFNKDGKDNWSFIMSGYFKRISKDKTKMPIVWYYPPELGLNNLVYLTRNMQDKTGNYDLRFGKSFYDFSWFKDFDTKKVLSSIECPTYVMHVAPSKETSPSYYDKNGILLSAMDEKDAKLVNNLIKGSILKGGYKSGHDIHQDLPDKFIKTVMEFKEYKDNLKR